MDKRTRQGNECKQSIEAGASAAATLHQRLNAVSGIHESEHLPERERFSAEKGLDRHGRQEEPADQNYADCNQKRRAKSRDRSRYQYTAFFLCGFHHCFGLFLRNLRLGNWNDAENAHIRPEFHKYLHPRLRGIGRLPYTLEVELMLSSVNGEQSGTGARIAQHFAALCHVFLQRT